MTKKPPTRNFERRLAMLDSALSWLVKNYDNNYEGRVLSPEEREIDKKDAWDNAHYLLGYRQK